MIRVFRSAHLQEQESARAHLNENRELARDRKQLFCHGDFMSEWATKLPHLRGPGNTLSKEDAGISMGLRLYAVEVIYGDIEGFMCYLVPGHLPGGKLHSHESILLHYLICCTSVDRWKCHHRAD